jgi:4-amino-4-deoxy-L-arabinose transferase
MFVTIPFVVMGANVVSPDMLLTCFETLAVLCFWRAARARGTFLEKRWIMGMWTAFGLAFLTKGPPGLLPLLAIFIFALLNRRSGFAMPRLANIVGLLLFVLTGFTWYIVSVVHDPSLLGYFLGKEVWGRVATGMHHRNSDWYMPIVIFGLPLLLGLGAWFVTAIFDTRACVRARGWRSTWRSGINRHESLFLLVWFLAPLAVFSVSKSRLPLYVLPLVPVQSLFLAHLAVRVVGEEKALRRGWRIAIVSAVALIALKVVAASITSSQNMLPLARQVRAAHADRVTVIDNGRLYGLQFYLDGALWRTTSAELAHELAEVGGRFAGHATRREVFLTGRSAPPLLVRQCGDGSLRCSVEADSDHQVWMLQPFVR